jgi:type IV pilus assembly protein PilA
MNVDRERRNNAGETMLKRIAKGFTLIELMIVVAIIGILAAIAIPNFVKFQCRSKQSEAKGNLKSMYVAQESYRAEFDSYEQQFTCAGIACTTLTNLIGFQAKGTKIRYNYEYAGGTTSGYVGKATVNVSFTAELSTDSWQVTQLNDVRNVTNGCL